MSARDRYDVRRTADQEFGDAKRRRAIQLELQDATCHNIRWAVIHAVSSGNPPPRGTFLRRCYDEQLVALAAMEAGHA